MEEVWRDPDLTTARHSHPVPLVALVSPRCFPMTRNRAQERKLFLPVRQSEPVRNLPGNFATLIAPFNTLPQIRMSAAMLSLVAKIAGPEASTNFRNGPAPSRLFGEHLCRGLPTTQRLE